MSSGVAPAIFLSPRNCSNLLFELVDVVRVGVDGIDREMADLHVLSQAKASFRAMVLIGRHGAGSVRNRGWRFDQVNPSMLGRTKSASLYNRNLRYKQTCYWRMRCWWLLTQRDDHTECVVSIPEEANRHDPPGLAQRPRRPDQPPEPKEINPNLFQPGVGSGLADSGDWQRFGAVTPKPARQANQAPCHLIPNQCT